ncbi:MAG: phosphoglycerate mutase (2,3-diphosphoglycerate-independent) [Flavobacteriaceae bacterium]|nr:phosphoglycerate mutase (2,3-diphosphoglycerate-independent) [Flavobacteriaceae bacterium]
MNKVLLMILDGWGKTTIPSASAIMNAHTPYIDNLYNKYSSSELLTHGDHVGLPNNQMGNSEVGHMNLGAGRIVLQDLARINAAIKQNKLREEKELINAYDHAKKHNKKIHFVGLLSDGGVHSHINHLIELLKIAKENDLSKLYIHGFTDGRDVDPKSAPKFLDYIKPVLDETGAKISTLIGRYYAMDRDQRWDRTEKAYNLLVENKGTKTDNLIEKLKINYKNGITDEFMPPIINTENGSSVSRISKNDVVIFFNFRTDRGRQLTNSLTNKSFNYFKVIPNKYYFVTLTNYDISFKNVKVIFDKDYLKFTLGEVLSKAGKTQVRIAETEKYPHVTFFFNGGREKKFKNEERILCPSPKVATYDLKPEMSAFEIKDSVIEKINKDQPDFICLNFANPDMVGHTGNFQAAKKACETIDKCVQEVIDQALIFNYVSLIIADHGNCETMVNEDGSPNTAHTKNPVPIILVDNNKTKVKKGVLANIAPTILDILRIKKPKEMTMDSLLTNQ